MSRHWECFACGEPMEGDVEYSIHKDGFGEGPEVPLCPECGGHPAPSCEHLWDLFKGVRFATSQDAMNFARFAEAAQPGTTFTPFGRYVGRGKTAVEWLKAADVQAIREGTAARGFDERDFAPYRREPELPRELEVKARDGRMVKGFEFEDRDGDRTQVYVDTVEGHGVDYFWQHFGPDFMNVPGHPLAMVRREFQSMRWYFCPRDRMPEDAGFHAPALEWLREQWKEAE